jgi:endoglucanase
MLQAVWMDDKNTFDQVWLWTKNTLKRKDDSLFGWRWGKNADNNYGFLPDGGENSAADADTDIALALILAGRRWRKQEYTDSAKPIINNIWKLETDLIKNKRYVVAGNWAKDDNKIVINVSYFAPYAWKEFHDLDSENDWDSLIDPAYRLLAEAGNNNLDADKSVGLPPDWLEIDKKDGNIRKTSIGQLTTNYGFDAIRTPWRIALDYEWNKEPKALDYLKTLNYLESKFKENGNLPIGYKHNGDPVNMVENPAMYATSLGYFKFINKDLGEKIYQEKIIQLYSNDTNSFRDDLPYYEENWLWFGSALYLNYLTNFKSG